MSRLSARRGVPERVEQRFSWDDYLEQVSFSFNGSTYGVPVSFTMPGSTNEDVGSGYGSYASVLKSNPILWACVYLRMRVFAQARFTWQELKGGRPGEMFGDKSLEPLESPWPGATTGEMLAQRILDVDLAGNSFIAKGPGRLIRLRPDWVTIAVDSPSGHPWDPFAVVSGYIYKPGGPSSDATPVTFDVADVSHWSPIPDPMARHRGMSPISTLVRDLESDISATEHKRNFFRNAATPNLAVSPKAPMSAEQAKEFLDILNQSSAGVRNAGKTLFLNGADVTVVGADLRQLDFKATQGAGESRIAAALGVPAGLVGLSEGMAANTYSNLAQSRRVLTDSTLSYYWQGCCGASQGLVSQPRQRDGAGLRLWYDVRDIPFLQDDADQAAETQAKEAQTIRTLTDGGFDPASVVDAVRADDWTRLTHTGMLSVQLVPPGVGGAEGGAESKAAPTINVDARTTVEPITVTIPERSTTVDARTTVEVPAPKHPTVKRVVRDAGGNISQVIEED